MALNTITPLTEYVFKVASMDTLNLRQSSEVPPRANTITLEYVPEASLAEQNYEFIQTEELTEAGVAVQPYGAILINTLAPTATPLTGINLSLKTPAGVLTSDVSLVAILAGGVGTRVTFAASDGT